MEKKSFFMVFLISFLVLFLSILFNKSLSSLLKIILSLLLIIISFILFFLLNKCQDDYKIKKEKELKEKLKQEEERKKKEEYEKLVQERKKHIEDLKKEGLNILNIQKTIKDTNIATNINIYQNDKIMITFYGGKLIIYSFDLIKYELNELLYIKEFSYNAYNAFEMKQNKNFICAYGYPGIKIIEPSINNLSGKDNNSYKVIQFFDCSEYNKEIIKVIELTNDTLISASTDYLLFWNKNNNNEYELNGDKIINYTKYENLLKISNILKIDEDNIVLLKVSNSNFTKSSLNFITINDAKSKNSSEETKIIDLKIIPLDDGNNNLCMINENLKIFCVGCINGLGIFSGTNKELLHFVDFESQINVIDLYFDKSLILFNKVKKESEEGENQMADYSYKLLQLKKDEKDENNYQYKNTIEKTNNLFVDGINAMKCLNNGVIIIGDKNKNIQIWH